MQTTHEHSFFRGECRMPVFQHGMSREIIDLSETVASDHVFERRQFNSPSRSAVIVKDNRSVAQCDFVFLPGRQFDDLRSIWQIVSLSPNPQTPPASPDTVYINIP